MTAGAMSLNSQPSNFIDVGGCGFRSIAVWLINYIEHTQDPWLKKPWVETVWSSLCASAPEYSEGFTRNSLSVQKIQHIILTKPRNKIIYILTQILATMACEELCTYPTKYRDFVITSDTLHPTPQFFLLKSNVMYLVALARAMSASITILSLVHPNKTHKLTHVVDSQNYLRSAHVFLRHDLNNYFQIVMPQQNWLNNLSEQHTLTMPDEYFASLEWVHAKIVTDEKLLLKKYDDACLKMINQWIHGSFNKEEGMELYVTMLIDRTKTSLLATHSQRYFEYLFTKYKHNDLAKWQRVNQDIIRQLIQSLARLMVL